MNVNRKKHHRHKQCSRLIKIHLFSFQQYVVIKSEGHRSHLQPNAHIFTLGRTYMEVCPLVTHIAKDQNHLPTL